MSTGWFKVLYDVRHPRGIALGRVLYRRQDTPALPYRWADETARAEYGPDAHAERVQAFPATPAEAARASDD